MNDYDYVSVYGMISAGGMLFCVDINITDDGALEGDQYFSLYLYSDDPGVLLGNNVTSIRIIDNDSKLKLLYYMYIKIYIIHAVVTLSTPIVIHIAEESGLVMICLSLTSIEETERPVITNVRTMDGIALGNYNSADHSVAMIY